MPGGTTFVDDTSSPQELVDAINRLNTYIATLPTGSYVLKTGDTMTGDLLFSVDNTHDIGASGATRPRFIFVGTGIGIGTTPAVAFQVQMAQSGDWLVTLKQTSAAAGSKGLDIETASTSASDAIVSGQSNGVVRFGVYGDGSILGKGAEAMQKMPVFEQASADTPLTTTFQNMTPTSAWPSLSIGNWIVHARFRFLHSGVGDTLNAINYLGQIACTGGTATIHNATALAICTPQITGQDLYPTQTWYVSVAAATTVSLQVKKSAGTGASAALQTYSTLTAGYYGNPV